ncbi:hypothetical protein POTOM_053568 [Populus tomentosa]|uniref:DUF4283 domain-containing protein n=1 Tax=Populus tomentosa TaxID=118781 RepID=A0A8X7Y1G4_POPTO|nr:hypothetical protein POTOM_053568 [Populus tomentosa]
MIGHEDTFDGEDDFCEETNGAATTHIETKQRPEFEYEFTILLGTQTQIASMLTMSEVSPLYLYPEITEISRHAGLSDESTYEGDNRLALVPYVCVEVDSAACREIAVQRDSCFTAKDGLDQHVDYDSGLLKKMGRKKKQKSSSIGLETNRDSTNIGPSFTTFITPIVDPYELSALEIKNRNVIIKAGKDLIGEDEASSSKYRPDTNAGDEANELAHSDNWAEATTCWEVGKAILQGHDDGTLMTQTLQGFLDRGQEEWTLRKKTEKKRCLRNLGRKFNLHILGILETKLETLNDFTITAIWGCHPKACCSIAMNGLILHIEGTFTRSNLDCLVSLVYAPNAGNLKNELWTYLVTFKDSVSKPWCLAGDFNETLFPSDRNGGS